MNFLLGHVLFHLLHVLVAHILLELPDQPGTPLLEELEQLIRFILLRNQLKRMVDNTLSERVILEFDSFVLAQDRRLYRG